MIKKQAMGSEAKLRIILIIILICCFSNSGNAQEPQVASAQTQDCQRTIQLDVLALCGKMDSYISIIKSAINTHSNLKSTLEGTVDEFKLDLVNCQKELVKLKRLSCVDRALTAEGSRIYKVTGSSPDAQYGSSNEYPLNLYPNFWNSEESLSCDNQQDKLETSVCGRLRILRDTQTRGLETNKAMAGNIVGSSGVISKNINMCAIHAKTRQDFFKCADIIISMVGNDLDAIVYNTDGKRYIPGSGPTPESVPLPPPVELRDKYMVPVTLFRLASLCAAAKTEFTESEASSIQKQVKDAMDNDHMPQADRDALWQSVYDGFQHKPLTRQSCREARQLAMQLMPKAVISPAPKSPF